MTTTEVKAPAPIRSPKISSPALVLAASLVSTLVILGTFVVFSLREREQEEQEAHMVATNTAAVLAENAGRLFEVSDLVMREAADLAGTAGELPDDPETLEELEALRSAAPYIRSVALGDAQGEIVLSSGDVPMPQANRGYFTGPRDDPDDLHIGFLPTNRYDQRALISMSRRLPPDEGPFRGFVHVAVSPEYIQSLYGNLQQGYETSFWLVRSDLTPILREPALPDEAMLEADLEPAFGLSRDTILGSFTAAEPVTGEERLFAYRKVPGYDVQVLVGIARADVAERISGRLQAYAWFGMAALLTIAGLSFMAWQRAFREREMTEMLESRVRERTAALEDALEQKNLLFREVNHRIKNSLQIVGSLLHLQERNVRDPEAKTHFSEAYGRVLTVARVHERLYKTDRVQSVAFGDYLRDLCDDIAASAGGNANGANHPITVDADDLSLSTDLVVNLALIVNELVTNALKYAYAPDEAGEIHVGAKAEDESLVIEVSDRGRGLPADFDIAAGNMGMTVVNALSRQLGADLEARNAEPGARFTLRVPLSRPPE